MFRKKRMFNRGSDYGRRGSTAGGVILEFAVLGGLLAGAVDIFKAMQMSRPGDILLCLFGSFTGCALICYLYFHRA
jgi:hypothetical protein